MKWCGLANSLRDRDIINNLFNYTEMLEKSGQSLSPCIEVNGDEVEAYLRIHDPSSSTPITQLTKRIIAGAGILQISFLDHVTVGQAIVGQRGFFSFQEAGHL